MPGQSSELIFQLLGTSKAVALWKGAAHPTGWQAKTNNMANAGSSKSKRGHELWSCVKVDVAKCLYSYWI